MQFVKCDRAPKGHPVYVQRPNRISVPSKTSRSGKPIWQEGFGEWHFLEWDFLVDDTSDEEDSSSDIEIAVVQEFWWVWNVDEGLQEEREIAAFKEWEHEEAERTLREEWSEMDHCVMSWGYSLSTGWSPRN